MIRHHPFRRAQARHMAKAMNAPRLPLDWAACDNIHCPSGIKCLRMVGASNLDKDRLWSDFTPDASGKCADFIEVK